MIVVNESERVKRARRREKLWTDCVSAGADPDMVDTLDLREMLLLRGNLLQRRGRL